MAKLLNLSTNKKVNLHQHHLVGRHKEAVQTFLEGQDVSRMHARIFWAGNSWAIQDTSRNGTYVNGNPIFRDAKKTLAEGDDIAFGNRNAPVWRLIDASPPVCLLMAVTPGLSEIELSGLHALPSEDDPQVMLYMSNEGKWLCESGSGIEVLKSGDRVGTSDKIWRFVDAAGRNMDTTLMHHKIHRNDESVQYTFNASQNEEHVRLGFRLGDVEMDLGLRQHHYLALVLARRRCKDQESGVLEEEEGWIDKEEFCKMLGFKEALINIHVYRLRKSFIKSLPRNCTIPMIIERRNCELRFGSNLVEIHGGNVVKLDLV